MKKKREIVELSSKGIITDEGSTPEKRDIKILNQINKRKEENEALKKLLENLNTSIPTNKAKKTNK